MKRITVALLLAFLIILSGCTMNSNDPPIVDSDDPTAEYTENPIAFTAELSCGGDVVLPDSVFDVEGVVENVLTLKSETGRLCMGMMLFADGIPLEFNIDGETKTYIEFTFTERKTVRFSYMSSGISSLGSDVHVVLLTNRDRKIYSDSTLKNYTYSISYTAKGSGGTLSAKSAEGVEYAELNEKINSSDASAAEKQQIIDLLNRNSVVTALLSPDMPETFLYSGEDYDEKLKEKKLYAYGKAGEYVTTVFSDGEKVGSSFSYSLEENRISALPFEKPTFENINRAGCVRLFALTYSKTEKRFYDSQECYVGFPVYSLFDAATPEYYVDGSVLENYDPEYEGGTISLRIERNYKIYYNASAHIVLLVDGVASEFEIGGETVTSYVHSFTNGKNVFELSFTPKLRKKGGFIVSLVSVIDPVESHPEMNQFATGSIGTLRFECSDDCSPTIIPEDEYIPEKVVPSTDDGYNFHYDLNGKTSGTGTRDVYVQGDKETVIELEFASDDIRNGFSSFLLLNDEVIGSRYVSFEEPSKCVLRYVIPSEKLSAENIATMYFCNEIGRGMRVRDVWRIHKSDVSPDKCDVKNEDGRIAFDIHGEGSVFVQLNKGSVNSILSYGLFAVSHDFEEAEAALEIQNTDYRIAVIQSRFVENGVYRFTRRVTTGFDR